MIQHCVHCTMCRGTIFLPPQILLEISENPPSPPTGDWTIDFLCIYCALVFSVRVEEIHQETVEGKDLNQPYLWRYEFASDDTHLIRKYSIYATTLMRRKEKVLIEGMLKPTGKWKPEHGEPRFVGFYPYPLL